MLFSFVLRLHLLVFSPSPDSILPYESPQAINAGVSFASTFVPESIIFAGIDLGATVTGDARADGTLGTSNQNFTIERPGNLSDLVYTEQALIDAQIQLERLMLASQSLANNYNRSIKFINMSDGLKINGATPVNLLT